MPPTATAVPRTHAGRPDLLRGPILSTLARLALPNVAALLAATAVGIGETWYVGLLGKTALAAMALVFPLVMLVQMLSAGAMGGGVSSAISRALGAGQPERARSLAAHALLIAVAMGSALVLLLGAGAGALCAALGGTGAVLQLARSYAAIVFLAALPVFVFNTLLSVARGTGDMAVPSKAILGASVAQLVLGGSLGLGLAGLPRLGMPGVAAGQVLAYAGAAAVLWRVLRRRQGTLLRFAGVRLQRELFHDILRVGALACLSPLFTVATVLVLTRLVAGYGEAALAGYGIGTRLEFLLVPIAFGVGVASVPMVGMAVGAGDVQRARRVAWSAAGLSALLVGGIGVVVALAPDLWGARFTTDPAVLAHARDYLRTAGPAFAFFGIGLTLYFASQGAGRVALPVAAAMLRFVLVAAAGLWLAGSGPVGTLFAVVAGAMVFYGTVTAGGLALTRWR